jgi:hypothetical protein
MTGPKCLVSREYMYLKAGNGETNPEWLNV